MTVPAFALAVKRPLPTVKGWLYQGYIPRPATIRRIKRLTKGKVTPADWY